MDVIARARACRMPEVNFQDRQVVRPHGLLPNSHHSATVAETVLLERERGSVRFRAATTNRVVEASKSHGKRFGGGGTL